MRLGTMLGLTLAAAAFAAPAAADQNDRWCAGEDGAASEQKIASCTAIIEAGKGSPHEIAVAYNLRGGQFYYKGEHLRAIADYDQAIRLDPNDAHALNNRCWANAVVGRLDAGLADCTAAARLSPDNGNVYENRAFIHLKMGNYDRAIADYDVAFKLEPESGDVLYGRGIAKVRKGDVAGGQCRHRGG